MLCVSRKAGKRSEDITNQGLQLLLVLPAVDFWTLLKIVVVILNPADNKIAVLQL